MAVIFYFANIPDLNTEDDYNLDVESNTAIKKSIWLHPHFVGAVLSQFLY